MTFSITLSLRKYIKYYKRFVYQIRFLLILVLTSISLGLLPQTALADTWTPDSFSTPNTLYGVSCVSSSFCKAVDDVGRIVSWDGSAWTADISGTTSDLYSVSCISSSFCKVVGGSGTIRSWDGSGWAANTTGTPNTLYGVSCVSSSFCKAVGDSGTIVSWDGSAWAADSSNASSSLKGVSCVSGGFCKAVGDGGKIVSWNGSAWADDSSGTTNSLTGVSCASSSFCKAVGFSGTIVSWDGSAWTADTSGTSSLLKGVSCISGGFCKAVASSGTIVSLVIPPTPPPAGAGADFAQTQINTTQVQLSAPQIAGALTTLPEGASLSGNKTYEIALPIQNTSPVAAPAVLASLTVPAGVQVVSVKWEKTGQWYVDGNLPRTCSYDGRTAYCGIGQLWSGMTATLTVRFSAAPGQYSLAIAVDDLALYDAPGNRSTVQVTVN